MAGRRVGIGRVEARVFCGKALKCRVCGSIKKRNFIVGSVCEKRASDGKKCLALLGILIHAAATASTFDVAVAVFEILDGRSMR
jgi:hypothetical protein